MATNYRTIMSIYDPSRFERTIDARHLRIRCLYKSLRLYACTHLCADAHALVTQSYSKEAEAHPPAGANTGYSAMLRTAQKRRHISNVTLH